MQRQAEKAALIKGQSEVIILITVVIIIIIYIPMQFAQVM
ncbi:MAG: hypothetical protein ACI9YH_001809 [Colwellia sp.]|jgi:hypothetical protein